MVKLTENIICSRTKISDLDMVRKLNCWGGELDDIEILQHLPNVEILSLSVNKISTLWPLAACTNLRELYVRNNKISDLRELRHLRRLPKLRTLWLSENPCADHPDYRHNVLKMLPFLTTLDNITVTKEEVDVAVAYDQVNSTSTDEGLLSAHSDEQNAHNSSPECDVVVSEFTASNNGLGYRTVRLAERSSSLNVRRPVEASERPGGIDGVVGMSASCYVPSSSSDFNGYNVRNDRRNTSASITSLYDAIPERSSYQDAVSRQQPSRRTPVNNPTAITSNVLSAIFTLLNDLDKRGLEAVINEAEARLRRM